MFISIEPQVFWNLAQVENLVSFFGMFLKVFHSYYTRSGSFKKSVLSRSGCGQILLELPCIEGPR